MKQTININQTIIIMSTQTHIIPLSTLRLRGSSGVYTICTGYIYADTDIWIGAAGWAGFQGVALPAVTHKHICGCLPEKPANFCPGSGPHSGFDSRSHPEMESPALRK